METLRESRETILTYPERFRVTETEVQQEVKTIRYFSEFVDPDEETTAIQRDPDDDKFLETAVAGDINYLVSGGSHLLDIESFRGIDIVEPRAFYERLNP